MMLVVNKLRYVAGGSARKAGVRILSLMMAMWAVALQAQTGKDTHLPEEKKRLFTYFYYEGVTAKTQGQHDVAFDFFRHCYQIDSTNAGLLNELGMYYSLLNKPKEAVAYFKKAVNQDSSNYYYLNNLADCYAELKQFDRAAEIYEQLTVLKPDKPDTYLALVEVQLLCDQKLQAIQTLDKLEKLIGQNENITLQKYRLYTLLGDKEKGVQEVKRYAEKFPNEAKYLTLLGNIYLDNGQKAEAWQALSQAKKLAPNDVPLVRTMARYHQLTGKQAEAEKLLSEAMLNKNISTDDKVDILTQYVQMLQDEKKNLSAISKLLTEMMKQSPTDTRLNLLYGNLLMMEEKKDEAARQYRTYAEANPTDPVGWEQLLRTTFPDDTEATITICEQALQHISDQPQFYFYLAISQDEKGLHNEAIQTMETGLANLQGKGVSHSIISNFYGVIGAAYHKLNNEEKAFQAFEEALKYNSQNLLILNNYSYYLSLANKDLQRAEMMSGITVKAEPSNPVYLDTYGWILYQQGVYAIAKTYLEKAVTYSGEEVSSTLLEHYGDALYRCGEPEKALEYWKKALEKVESTNPILEEKVKTGKLETTKK